MAATKVVSVSLFGTNEKYLRGAEKLATSIQANLPNWNLVFFIGNSVPTQTKDALLAQNATLLFVDEPENLSATAWRFRIWELGQPDWILFRDSDSVISRREASAVNQWVESGFSAHIIRDHPFHSSKMLAGLWGMRRTIAEWFIEEAKQFNFLDFYGADQEFLANRVYPRIVESCMVHASFHRHENESQIFEFTEGSSRVGTFCGESLTDHLIVRAYARIRRLVDSKSCHCKK